MITTTVINIKIQFPLLNSLEILQFIYMTATVETFLSNIICIRKEILGEVLDMIPSERNTLFN